MKITPMRGQVVVREIKRSASSVLWTPDDAPRSVKSHRGKVLAIGAPVLTPTGAEVPYDFVPGDEVLYHFVHNEKAWTERWSDGEPATWVPAQCVDAVVSRPAALSEAIYGVESPA